MKNISGDAISKRKLLASTVVQEIVTDKVATSPSKNMRPVLTSFGGFVNQCI